ncbi:DKNYY domain-containing protein [Pontibacter anaerobius]|uniref:DKNYY domain-containing protein n=1 Tax=Pontibacter anaerobius TaxID=2993940 RepID=A0ABT3RD54_9BACT|nr:DKNYY domain-containing protein [Pontibacter anaerobius]MCX2739778.1 DKNYY domain-containing protein [Pontibacter anaerobius]
MKISFTINFIAVLLLICSCGTNKIHSFQTKVAPESQTTNTASDWIALQEDQAMDGYYRKNGKIYCGGTPCGDESMSGVDVGSFQVYPGSGYAKDMNAVYYPILLMSDHYTNCATMICAEYVVEGAQPSSFKYLERDYALDENAVYYSGEIITVADVRSLKVLTGPKKFCIAVDKSHVYIGGIVIPNADPITFSYDSTGVRINDVTYSYTLKDRRHTWEYIPPHKFQLLDSLSNTE